MSKAELQLSAKEMRDLGYRVVDLLVEHFDHLRGEPTTRVSSRAEMESHLREPLPVEGSDPEAVIDRVIDEVFANMMHIPHPRFFAYVPSPSNFISVLADALVSGYNPFAGTWIEASGPAQIELVTIDWLRQLIGMPETTGGIFTSGGSMANLTGLAVARQTKLGDDFSRGTIYFSDQTHSSVERGLKVLGFQEGQFRRLPSDSNFTLPLEELQKKVRQDRKAGHQPFCVVANAGTTNTGAIDPFQELALICEEEGLWLHADGAYGAAAVLSRQGKEQLAGLEQVDSVAFDPHKWLFQPYEIGCVLVREASLLRDTFRILPAYLQDLDRSFEEINYCDYGVQLTRSFRALKLWMSLKVFGLEAFREAVEWGIRQAEIVEEYLREHSVWHVTSPAQIGVVTFRYRVAHLSPEKEDAFQKALVEAVISDGYAMIHSTELGARTVLRMCTINPRTTEKDLTSSIKKFEKLAEEIEIG